VSSTKNWISNKWIHRFLFYVLISIIVWNKHYLLLMHSIFFYISFESLNQNANYLSLKRHDLYNWIFIFFLAFITWVRTRSFPFSESIEFHLNTAEHLFFAITVCVLVTVYLQLFGVLKANTIQNLVLVLVVFNLIGVVNEWVQNYFREVEVFTLDQSNIKDIVINAIGSVLFLIGSIDYKLRK
jgi:hypothetical protein